MIQPEQPNQPLDESTPKYKDVVDIIKKARAASAPGPNGVPYKVNQKFQRLTRHLWELIRVDANRRLFNSQRIEFRSTEAV